MNPTDIVIDALEDVLRRIKWCKPSDACALAKAAAYLYTILISIPANSGESK